MDVISDEVIIMENRVKKRSSLGYIGFYHLHLLLALAVGLVAGIVDFAFARKLSERSWSVDADLNVFSLAIGFALFVIGIFYVWNRFLRDDWAGIKGTGAGYIIWMIAISLGAALVYLVGFFAVAIIMLGFFDEVVPVSPSMIFVLSLAYAVLMPVINVLWNKFVKKEAK